MKRKFPYFIVLALVCSHAAASFAQTETPPAQAKERLSFESNDMFFSGGFGFGNLLVALSKLRV